MLKNEITMTINEHEQNKSGLVSPIMNFAEQSQSLSQSQTTDNSVNPTSSSSTTVVQVSSSTSENGGMVAEQTTEQKLVVKDGEVVEKTLSEKY